MDLAVVIKGHSSTTTMSINNYSQVHASVVSTTTSITDENMSFLIREHPIFFSKLQFLEKAKKN